MINWISNYNDKNVIFIINGKCINYLEKNINCALIYLSKMNFLEEYSFQSNELNDYLYISNPFVIKNKNRQTKENIAKIDQFNDKNTTFYLIFNNDSIQMNL